MGRLTPAEELEAWALLGGRPPLAVLRVLPEGADSLWAVKPTEGEVREIGTLRSTEDGFAVERLLGPKTPERVEHYASIAELASAGWRAD